MNILDNQKLGIVIAIAPLDSEDLPTGFPETLGEQAGVCAVEVSRLFTVPAPGDCCRAILALDAAAVPHLVDLIHPKRAKPSHQDGGMREEK